MFSQGLVSSDSPLPIIHLVRGPVVLGRPTTVLHPWYDLVSLPILSPSIFFSFSSPPYVWD